MRLPARRWLTAFAAPLLLGALPVPSIAAAQPTGDTLRATLAKAYLTVDRITSRRTFDDATRATINRAFDRTTLQFFGGRFAEAARSLDSLTAALGLQPGDAPDPPPLGAARAIDGRPPSAVRDELLARLARVDSTGPLQQALAAAVSRAGLLTDVPSSTRSAELFVQPRAHAAAVRREVDALRAGRDPYAGRSGDWWREIVADGGRRVPVRVVVPPSAVDGGRRAPLLVALHGAGGDENMFVDAYGDGVLVRLADSLGAIVVSPLANGATPVTVDSLLAVVTRGYAIDTTRVFAIGHSMGAGIVARLANTRGHRLAGVAMLAGGAAITAPDAPPALFVGAALDPVIPAARVRAAAEATTAAGRRAEYRELAHEGHTLMVGPAVPLAIAWLWATPR
jgi:phospholipase/carboxylesterase